MAVPSSALRRHDAGPVLATFAIAVLLLAFASLALGPYHLTWADVFAALAAPVGGLTDTSLARLHETVIWQIRLPRVLLVLLVGLALPVTGATYQGVFRNPLVDPFILGVASGASFGAGLALLLPGFPASV